jgi:RNA polymerase sigma-70 factor (ECF subfamily)
MEDEQAVRRCQDGDDEVFRHLVERYGNVMYGTAFLMTRDATESADCVQEAFVSAWRAIGGFRPGSPVKPWLVHIVVNRVISNRRRRSLPLMPIPDALQLAGPDRTADEVEAREMVRLGLTELSSEYRQVVLLRYFAGLTVLETAAALGWPDGTVKSRLHRALAQMRSVLGEPG